MRTLKQALMERATTLDAFGSSGLTDRCAYGSFHRLLSVVVTHTGGGTRMCAGATSAGDGGGWHVSPRGAYCSTTNVYTYGTPYVTPATAGYATIFNRDNATHYNFQGDANYG